MPVEVLSWANESSASKTVQLVVNRALGEAAPRVKLALLENGSGVEATEYPRSSGEDVVGPTIFGHSGSASAISVAAVPFNSNSQPEPYSSRGPVIHGFGPVEGTDAGRASRSAGGNHQQARPGRDRLRQDDLLRDLRLALLALLRDLRRRSSRRGRGGADARRRTGGRPGSGSDRPGRKRRAGWQLRLLRGGRRPGRSGGGGRRSARPDGRERSCLRTRPGRKSNQTKRRRPGTGAAKCRPPRRCLRARR